MTFLPQPPKAAEFSLLPGLWVAAAVASAVAQPMFVISPGFPSPRPVEAQSEIQPSADPNSETTGSALQFPSLLGRALAVHPHITYTFTRGDGIPAQLGQRFTTDLSSLAAGFSVQVGTRWKLGYTGTTSYYSHQAFDDTFNHRMSLSGGTTYEDWTLRFLQTYETRSSSLVETGQQTREGEYATTANVTYLIFNDAIAEFSFSPSTRSPDGFSVIRSWPVDCWMHYRMSPWLTVGAGLRSGYDDIRPGSNMFYDRPQLRLQWHPTDTFVVQLSGGQEHRRIYSRHVGELRRAVFETSLQFRPAPTTTISILRNRGLNVSTFLGQLTEGTERQLQVRQRLLERFELSASTSRFRIRYLGHSPATEPVTLRRDWLRSFSLQLTTSFRTHTTLSLRYQESRNLSNTSEFSFTSSQYGFEIGFRY